MRRVTAGVGLLLVMLMFLLILEPVPVHAASAIVQQNSNGCTSSCSTTLVASFASVSMGDVLVVGVYVLNNHVDAIVDTMSTSFAVVHATDGSEDAYIYYGTLSSSGPETVTVTVHTNGAHQNVYLYEVRGVTTTGAGTGSDSNTVCPIDAGSGVTFTPGAFLLGMIGTQQNHGATTVTPGTGFALSTDNTGGYSHAQYSTSGVTSPTTFPATCSTSSRFTEAGLALNPSSLCVPTAAGGATACAPGFLSSFSPVAVSSISTPPPSTLLFPYGLFSLTVSGLTAGATVTVTITLSNPLPAGSFSYWKFQSGTWTQFPGASLDSTRTIITLTLTADSTGTVTDPGGPAIPAAPTKLAVSHVPVGGVMLPSVGFTVLLPWGVLLSLLGVLSVEAFRVKRRAKQR